MKGQCGMRREAWHFLHVAARFPREILPNYR